MADFWLPSGSGSRTQELKNSRTRVLKNARMLRCGPRHENCWFSLSSRVLLSQIPKFGIVLVLVVVLVLGALGFRDRKETDVLQLICSVSLIAKRSGFSRTRTTTSTRTIVLWLHCAVREARSIYFPSYQSRTAPSSARIVVECITSCLNGCFLACSSSTSI